MKLLEDIPSAVAHHPTRRRTGITLLVTVALLVVSGIVGATLMLQGTDDTPDGAAGGDAGQQVALTEWVDGATQACTAVAAEHPVLTQGQAAYADAANAPAVEAGTRALATAVRDLPRPTEAGDNENVGAVVGLGDQADQAWAAVSASGAVTPDLLTQASASTTAFVAGLVELGADCSAVTG